MMKTSLVRLLPIIALFFFSGKIFANTSAGIKHDKLYIKTDYLTKDGMINGRYGIYSYLNTNSNKKSNGSQPVADAGDDITTVMPLNKVFLDASRTAGENEKGGYIFYQWQKISGPDQYTIKYPDRVTTELRDLVVGVYAFKLTIHINSDGERVSDTVKVTVKADPVSPGDVSYNANTRVNPYTALFQYGTNTGSYGNGWNDTTLVSAAARAGTRSIRLPLPEYFVERYNYDVRLKAFNYYTQELGMKEITLFVGEPTDGHRDHTIYPTATREAATFAHLYEPIWDNGENGTPVNENNYFANYIYNLIKRYGKDVRIWEIVNEPDITGFWDNENLSRPDNWLENPPSPGSLINLRAPIFNYIRMLRIAYEVVKKFKPDDYVAPGGIGNPAFLDALLRYTDNPDQGKVTSAYPLTGGAYFDMVSFHGYPAYFMQEWSNLINNFLWFRHSDRGAQSMIDLKNRFESILLARGYNGTKYPKKPFIISETNMTRNVFDTYFGSAESQRNFIIKMLVKAQKNNISQLYIYTIGDNGDFATATSAYQLMGLYGNLTVQGPGQEKLTDEGKAFKTTSILLYGWRYDAARTNALNLPSGIGGAAFKQGTEFRYVLWAKTTVDGSEIAHATYSFPSSFGLDSIYRYAWDYSTNPNAQTKSSSNGIQLTGAPSFFSEKVASNSSNRSPVADAGTNQTITLPNNTIQLDGSGSFDPDGSSLSYQWAKKSGPTSFSFSNAKGALTDVSGLVEGTYIFTLTVTDDQGAIGHADVQIIVNKSSSTNKLPKASAGGYQTIMLPANSVKLSASGSYDPDGTIASYQWTQFEGPSKATFNNYTAVAPTVSNLKTGVYVFDLTITDNDGGKATGRTQVTVKPSTTNIEPKASAGGYQTVKLPTNSVKLNGSGSYDPDGSISSYQWTQFGGPSKATFNNPTAVTPTISNLVAGVYVFDLTVTDNNGGKTKGRTQVTVKAADNKPPKASAGGYQTIKLPTNSVKLNASSSYDPDGNISSYQWTQFEGPSKADFNSITAVMPTISNLVAGVYVFDLSVTDNDGAKSTGRTQVTVKPADNKPPRASAGGYQTIKLPTNSTELNASGSYDPDGSISSYQWNQFDGPSKVTFSSTTAMTPTITNLVTGVYTFDLTVTDNDGSKTTGRTQVTVKPADNLQPKASAGGYQSISLPTTSVELNASSSYDPDGSISSYQWTQFEGPSKATFSSNTAITPTISNLGAGVYIFDLTVTDNDGAKATGRTQVTVFQPATFESNYTVPSIERIATIRNYSNNQDSQLFEDSSKTALSMFYHSELDSSQADLLIYPNPVHDVLYVNLYHIKGGKTIFRLIDMNGRVVKMFSYDVPKGKTSQMLHLEGIAPGVYLLQLVEDHMLKGAKKIIKY